MELTIPSATIHKYIKVSDNEALRLELSILCNRSCSNEFDWFKDQHMQEILVIAHRLLKSFLSRNEKEIFSFTRSGDMRILSHIKESPFHQYLLVPTEIKSLPLSHCLPSYGFININGKKVVPYTRGHRSFVGHKYSSYKVLPHVVSLYADSFDLPSHKGIVLIRRSLDPSWVLSSHTDIVSLFQTSSLFEEDKECSQGLSPLKRARKTKRLQKAHLLSSKYKKTKLQNSPGQTTLTGTFTKRSGGCGQMYNPLHGIDKNTNIPSSISSLILTCEKGEEGEGGGRKARRQSEELALQAKEVKKKEGSIQALWCPSTSPIISPPICSLALRPSPAILPPRCYHDDQTHMTMPSPHRYHDNRSLKPHSIMSSPNCYHDNSQELFNDTCTSVLPAILLSQSPTVVTEVNTDDVFTADNLKTTTAGADRNEKLLFTSDDEYESMDGLLDDDEIVINDVQSMEEKTDMLFNCNSPQTEKVTSNYSNSLSHSTKVNSLPQVNSTVCHSSDSFQSKDVINTCSTDTSDVIVDNNDDSSVIMIRDTMETKDSTSYDSSPYMAEVTSALVKVNSSNLTEKVTNLSLKRKVNSLSQTTKGNSLSQTTKVNISGQTTKVNESSLSLGKINTSVKVKQGTLEPFTSNSQDNSVWITRSTKQSDKNPNALICGKPKVFTDKKLKTVTNQPRSIRSFLDIIDNEEKDQSEQISRREKKSQEEGKIKRKELAVVEPCDKEKGKTGFDLHKMVQAASQRIQQLEENKKSFTTQIEFSDEIEKLRAKIRGDKEVVVLSSEEEEEEMEPLRDDEYHLEIERWRKEKRSGPKMRQAVKNLFARYNDINELPQLVLLKWMKLRKQTLVKIFLGKVKSERHDKYCLGKKEKATLQCQISTVMLTSEQIDILTNGLHDIFCHRSQQNFDYVWLVLYPETIIHLIMDYHEMNYDEAEHKMYNYYPVKREII